MIKTILKIVTDGNRINIENGSTMKLILFVPGKHPKKNRDLCVIPPNQFIIYDGPDVEFDMFAYRFEEVK